MSAQKYGSEGTEKGAPGGREDLLGQALMLYRISRSAAWTAFFALVIAIGLAAGGYFLWRQLTVMEDQLSELQDLSEKVKQSFDTGAAQSAGLTTALQSLTEQMTRGDAVKDTRAGEPGNAAGAAAAAVSDRPWIGVDAIAAGALQANRKFISNVNVRNAGRSPATNVRATWNIAATASGDIASPEIEPCSKCAETVLLPNAAVAYELAIDESVLTSDKLNRIRNGDDGIVIFGRIDYADSFGGNHITRVCMIYVPGLSRFSACAQGNRFD
jgi:hypothetical protein